MIRVLVVLISLLTMFILSLVIWPVMYVYGKVTDDYKRDLACLRLIQWYFKLVLWISGTKVTVKGIENIPKDEAVVYVGNHRGIFDVIISYSMMPGLTGYIAKKEIDSIPFLRVWMRMLHCIFMDRKNPKEGLKAILHGVEELKAGVSVNVFPEGTRNKGEGVLKFHGGSFKLADKAECKIVPMVQNNTEAVFEAHFPFIKRAHTVIEFCPPIDVAAMDKNERKLLPDMTRDIIVEVYERNQMLV